MNTLSIDVETFSDVDISKCGAYKYAESSSFEILLFAYAADGGEVQVVDLANGEQIPQEILAALTDDNVIKWAFNANFERSACHAACQTWDFFVLPSSAPKAGDARWFGQRTWGFPCPLPL